jgi:hypothetical protein
VELEVCPFRFIDRGRTFCRIAIAERRHTTTEVTPPTCASCRVPPILADHPCRHMDLGVEIDEYMGSTTAETYFASCRVTVERILDLSSCRPERCPHWAVGLPGSEEEGERPRAQSG